MTTKIERRIKIKYRVRNKISGTTECPRMSVFRSNKQIYVPVSYTHLGNALPLQNIPVGTVIHNIELRPGQGAALVRSAGNFAQLTSREGKYCVITVSYTHLVVLLLLSWSILCVGMKEVYLSFNYNDIR